MAGWYMNYLIVRDVQTDDKWVFIADKWFAVEEDDSQVIFIEIISYIFSLTRLSVVCCFVFILLVNVNFELSIYLLLLAYISTSTLT